MAAAYQRFVDNAQDASSEASGNISQVGQMLAGENLTQYLPGCGINVGQALNLLAQANNLAKSAASNVSAAFAAAGCAVPGNIATLLAAANAKPTWEGFPGDTYGTYYATGAGSGACLDTQTYLPSVEQIVSAAEQAVSQMVAVIASCGTKSPRMNTPVKHIPPMRGNTNPAPKNTPVPLASTATRVANYSVSEGTKSLTAKPGLGPRGMRGIGQVPTVSSTASTGSPGTSGAVLESAVGLGMLGLLFGGIIGLFTDSPGESAAVGGVVGAVVGGIGAAVYENSQANANTSASTTTSTAASGG